MTGAFFFGLLYLLAAVFFVFGIRQLQSVRTARQGNLVSAGGMLLAVGTTLWQMGQINWGLILSAVGIGTVIGAVSAMRVPMTAMPQMVAIFNGFGGGASLLVATAELLRAERELRLASLSGTTLTTMVLSALIGGVTFTGSLVAFGKLQGLLPSPPILFRGQHTLNLALFLLAVLLGAGSVRLGLAGQLPEALPYYAGVAVLALVLGVLLVIPIGGGDMPVVISLLNSYSGMAVCTTGFVLNNAILIVAGALVGASGLILTAIMCKAMNRSLVNVAFGGFGAVQAGATTAEQKSVKAYNPEDVVPILENAREVIIVPGYGMAVAQAQHAVKALMDQLLKRGVKVRFAIHPVAGRMPGHMNVLLAEADVPYELLYDLDQINEDFKHTDAVLVVGANDVVNPAAKTDPKSPLYGMPVLNVDEARTVIVLKRSLRPGFAGVDNPLFYLDNTIMVFGDAKDSLLKMVEELKQA